VEAITAPNAPAAPVRTALFASNRPRPFVVGLNTGVFQPPRAIRKPVNQWSNVSLFVLGKPQLNDDEPSPHSAPSPDRAVPRGPTFEHHREALGIGEGRPRLSWKTTAPPQWHQVGYEIEVTRAERTETSGRVESSESVLLPWPTEPLTSRETALVRVRLWGDDEAPSSWSPATSVEAGLLDPSDWRAVPVGPRWLEDTGSDTRRPPLLRRGFVVPGAPAKARLYVTAHGVFEVEINGQRVGNDAMAPGWTVYPSRLRYFTYDVSALIAEGDNTIGAWLGDGWYRGRLGWNGGFRNIYGSDISLIAQLEIQNENGETLVVATDEDWRASPGPILSSGIYDGEIYDARSEQSGWSLPGFDDSSWGAVAIGHRDPGTLFSPIGPPIRCTEEINPRSVLTTPSGQAVLDLGQNMVGRIRIRVNGERGQKITMSTSEVLQDGEIYTRPLRTAKSTDVYVLAGGGVEEWEPRFTLHGFRYVQVEGWPGDLESAVAGGDIVGRVYHTDMERTGWFGCSDPMLNQLHDNVVWGMRGNFVDIPTDCPQRDERVGWTGDIQVFAPTASFLFDCSGMLTSWLRDLSIEQLADGTVPWYVPVIPAHKTWTPIRPGAVWGDAAVLVPWTLYERFGDAQILERQFHSAKAWVDLVDSLAGEEHLWNEGFQLGDWLDPSAPPQDPSAATTDPYLVATAYFAWSAAKLAIMAEVLGRHEDSARYGHLAALVRGAFASEYLLSTGRLASDTQTAYSLAIRFALLPPQTVPSAGSRLAELVHLAGGRVRTGFAGTPVICDALTIANEIGTAYQLLLNRECPSWLYGVQQGATTVWERWDSLLPDGTVNPGTMTSFNHYAFGSVADWMHRVIAGLAPLSPGYKDILFRPRPGGGITAATARHESPYGLVAISWRVTDRGTSVDLTVPTGSTALLDLEGTDPMLLGPGHHSVAADRT
jgi:alpha-L-rhamnosidase